MPSGPRSISHTDMRRSSSFDMYVSSCCVKGCRQAACSKCQRSACAGLCQCAFQCEKYAYTRVVAPGRETVADVWREPGSSPVVSVSSTWCSISLHPKPFSALLLQHDHPFIIPAMARSQSTSQPFSLPHSRRQANFTVKYSLTTYHESPPLSCPFHV